jgi:hypothetical protein
LLSFNFFVFHSLHFSYNVGKNERRRQGNAGIEEKRNSGRKIRRKVRKGEEETKS